MIKSSVGRRNGGLLEINQVSGGLTLSVMGWTSLLPRLFHESTTTSDLAPIKNTVEDRVLSGRIQSSVPTSCESLPREASDYLNPGVKQVGLNKRCTALRDHAM